MKLCRFQGWDHQSHTSTVRGFRSQRKAVHGGQEWTWSEKGEGGGVQSLSHVWLFTTPWTTAHQGPLSFTVSQSLLRFMPSESVMLSNHLILCYPLLLLSMFPSIRVFSSESTLRIRWPKYWSFGFSISPSNGYSGLISFRIDWFDLFLVYSNIYLYVLFLHILTKGWENFIAMSEKGKFCCSNVGFYTSYLLYTPVFLGFPCGSAGKESACNAGGLGWIPGLERSPEEGKGYPLQYSGLENSKGSQSWTQLRNFHFHILSIHFCTVYFFKIKTIF